MKIDRIAILLFASVLFAQNGRVTGQITVPPPARISASPGEIVESAITIRIGAGLHANSNTPADPFLIPMRLTWSSGAVESAEVTFPKPQVRSLGFSKTPVSIFNGDVAIVTRFKVASGAQPGAATFTGKLHYQACDEQSCFPPATAEITVPVEIKSRRAN